MPLGKPKTGIKFFGNATNIYDKSLSPFVNTGHDFGKQKIKYA